MKKYKCESCSGCNCALSVPGDSGVPTACAYGCGARNWQEDHSLNAVEALEVLRGGGRVWHNSNTVKIDSDTEHMHICDGSRVDVILVVGNKGCDAETYNYTTREPSGIVDGKIVGESEVIAFEDLEPGCYYCGNDSKWDIVDGDCVFTLGTKFRRKV